VGADEVDDLLIVASAKRCPPAYDQYLRLLALFFDILANYCLYREIREHGYRPGVDDAYFFASNAIYPLSLMPGRLRLVSRKPSNL
jgi:hypothetical protein